MRSAGHVVTVVGSVVLAALTTTVSAGVADATPRGLDGEYMGSWDCGGTRSAVFHLKYHAQRPDEIHWVTMYADPGKGETVEYQLKGSTDRDFIGKASKGAVQISVPGSLSPQSFVDRGRTRLYCAQP